MSLVNAQKFLHEKIFENYKKRNNVELRDSEMLEVESLLNFLESNEIFANNNLALSNHFFVGFSIEQIAKEFDLLRLGKNYSINIELKSKSTKEKILNQLKKNKYYLNFLETDFHYLTYVTNENKLYKLNDDNTLEEVNTDYLVDLLHNQKFILEDDINKYFNPSNYLVSPFNSTEKFIQNEYFLTTHQDEIKTKIENDIIPYFSFASIEGSAGTGKTLLAYDIIASSIQKKLNTLVIHCGFLNDGQNKLNNEYHWNICSIKNYSEKLTPNLNLILIDEAQRINPNQLETIILFAKSNNISCIFSYDPFQCLSNSEIKNDTSKIILQESLFNVTLKKKIRTNKEIASFIKYFFHKPVSASDFYEIKQSDFSNIEIQYFKEEDIAKKFVMSMQKIGWEHVNYTVSRYTMESLDKTILHSSRLNSHEVIGQEFDNVIVIIDETFVYVDNKLGGIKETYYNSIKMLFQMLTRARKKLCLVILNNENVLNGCLDLVSKQNRK